jgi:diketogulonate reductase-like aldo/keto reductase
MKTKTLGHTNEWIPEVGLGTWDYRGGNEPLRVGVSLGARLIDTAEMYGTEEEVGRAVEGLTDVLIATKVSAHHLHHDDVIRAAEASLRRLKVKTIDLYQVHWPNSRIPIQETMRAMEELVKAGKIRYVGVSNFSVPELEEAREALASGEIVSNQVEYSLLSREIEADILPYCARERITVIAYSPLARGRLASGRDEGTRFLERIGEKYGKTASQVALNWLTSQDGVVVIPKANSVEHVREDVGASGWRLSSNDFDAISRRFS